MKSESACLKAYQKEVERQFDPYKQWIEEYEEEVGLNPHCDLTYKILFMEECAGNWDITKYNEDIIILYSMKGVLDERAANCILKYMQQHEDVALAYADEDYFIEDGVISDITDLRILHQIGVDVEHCNPNTTGRVAPWFKPDYSPDTLLSFQYFGNIVALRTTRIRRTKVDVLTSPDSSVNLYDFFLKVSEKAKIGHIHEVLFHRQGVPSYALPHGTRKKYNEIKAEALKRRGMTGVFHTDEEGYTSIRYVPEYNPKVSIIIPSKDHPELLKMCIGSIRKLTKYSNYEIIVVDNGSACNHQIENEELAKRYDFRYLYQPMDFNFSKMCNIGAASAKGELLLFLNDDIEIVQEDWLEIMVGQAFLSHVGAVGVKLLYPGSTLIQHCGISNATVGPVHRLHNYSDEFSRYYGRNRMTYNYIGVTAACMMVKKRIFDQLDGFCEEIKVAYNDVDFCFRLYEAGFNQVVRNDVMCYHHESISRGKDEAGAKKVRLDSERKLLYERHPQLSPDRLDEDIKQSIDPFCTGTQLWKRNSMFMPGYLYEYENKKAVTEIAKLKNDSYHNMSNHTIIHNRFLCHPRYHYFDRSHVMISVDSRENNDLQYILTGWALLTKNDNALFEKHILLKDEKQNVLVIEPHTVLREDVAQYIEGQTNVLLAGFVLRLEKGSIPAGKYQIGVLFTSKTDKKKYAGYSEEYWEIE